LKKAIEEVRQDAPHVLCEEPKNVQRNRLANWKIPQNGRKGSNDISDARVSREGAQQEHGSTERSVQKKEGGALIGPSVLILKTRGRGGGDERRRQRNPGESTKGTVG